MNLTYRSDIDKERYGEEEVYHIVSQLCPHTKLLQGCDLKYVPSSGKRTTSNISQVNSSVSIVILRVYRGSCLLPVPSSSRLALVLQARRLSLYLLFIMNNLKPRHYY